MHPVLFEIGNVTLYTYGLFVGLGFLTAVIFAGRRAAVIGVSREEITDLFFVILVASILGARFFYVLINFNDFAAEPLSVFKIWTGGLVFYGGFIAALLSALVYAKLKGLPLWKTGDIIAPGIALGHAVGRMGCFFAGCCYGGVCELPWAVTFEDPNSLAPLHTPLHPTQIYSVISNLVIFAILIFMDTKKRFDGMIFWLYILLYGLFRSFVEIFRGDPRGVFMVPYLSVSQGIGLSMSAVALTALILLYRRHRQGIDPE
ncbi:MAG: prolipoprotein diacylglyceryl transferase [Desulfamplus sp.]|nr:prolipoprotein diacylglyceryl transferase [Desulfamplus sp.]